MNHRAFHRQRPLVCLALCLGLGVLIGGLWTQPVVLLPWLGIALAAIAMLLYWRSGGAVVIPTAFLLLFAGMLLAVNAANPALPPPGDYQVSARAAGMSERRELDGRARLTLHDLRLSDAEGKAYRVPGAWFTYYPKRDEALPQDGQTLRFQSRLYWPSPQQNPHGFDFRLFLLQRNIPVGLSGAKDLQLTPENQLGPASPWLRLRLWMAGRLDQLLKAQSPLAQALPIGQRDALPEEVSEDFRDAGIAHLLSVSGLHVGILAYVLLAVLRRFKINGRFQLVLLGLFLLAYCRLLDFAAPVVRASVLALFLSFGRLLHRRSDPLTSLAAAFMLILLFRPLDLFHVGFQLSFLAVLGIATLGDRLQAAWLSWREERSLYFRHLDGVASAMAATLSASLFTAPLVMRAFHYVSPVGLLFSPLICALIGIVMSYALALLPLSLISVSFAALLAAPLRWMIQLLLDATAWTASLPFASIRTAAPGIPLILALLLVLLLMSRYSRLRPTWRVLTAVTLLVPSVGLAFIGQGQAVRYTQFSLGNADAAVIEDGARTYLIDAGEQGAELSSYLLSRGRQVDVLYISHLHFDHIGGLEHLLKAGVPILQIHLPYGAERAKIDARSLALLDQARAQGITVQTIAAGDGIDEGRLSMQVLWPVRDRLYPGMDPNHGSLVMRWELDGVSLLTTGDLTREYERYAAAPAQMIKVAHHGSKGSTSEDFLDVVQPQIALLSASETQLGRMGDLLERLTARGCESYSTALGGALTLHVQDGRVRIDPFLKGGTP